MASSLLLNGKVAIVTGGGGGIGRAICKVFAKEGAKLIATDINESSVRETVGSLPDFKKHFAYELDVSKSDCVQAFVSRIQLECPLPQILVNCAGITRDCLMVNMTEEMFDDVIAVNLKGTYLMTQAISKLMIGSKSEAPSPGAIVNISSVSGKIGNLGQINYAASKAGVEGLTKTAARELAQYNIRCNAVMPGFIDTPIIATVPGKLIDKFKKEIPLGRLGTPEEIADVVSFLASERSSYITGGIIQVSGGLYM